MIYRVKGVFKFHLKLEPAIITKVLHCFTEVHRNMPDGTPFEIHKIMCKVLFSDLIRMSCYLYTFVYT